MATAVAKEIEELKERRDSEVLRLRDLMLFLGSKSITDEQLKAFTKTYSEINITIDTIEHRLYKLNKQKDI